MRQTITRKGSFDAAHRVMREKVKCFNVHGHLYQYELTFTYDEMESIGYAIDFKEIKRIVCEFIDEYFDHGFIANPQDAIMIEACEKLKSKLWIISLNGTNFCNPTAENISKELFLCTERLMSHYPALVLTQLRLYETPNCFVDCFIDSISPLERFNFEQIYGLPCDAYRDRKGKFEYDDQKKILS